MMQVVYKALSLALFHLSLIWEVGTTYFPHGTKEETKAQINDRLEWELSAEFPFMQMVEWELSAEFLTHSSGLFI